MSSFFTIPKPKKRKIQDTSGPPKKRIASTKPTRESRPAPKRPQRDESISGSEDESDGPRDAEDEVETSGSSEGEEEETAAERRLKLAERYLQNVREEVVDPEGFDAEEIDRDLIAERLKEDVAETKGRMYRKLADDLDFGSAKHSWFKWNSESVTGIATCAPWAYTVSKDLGLAKWRIQDLPEHQWQPKPGKKKSKKPTPPPKRKPEQVAFARGDKSKAKDNAYEGHVDTILCVAASQDGKFVVTGGKDRRIIVWEAETLKPLRVFTHHRDTVTSLTFRRGTNQMYSASKDRTLKVWSLDELAYVETLFGHQDEVVDVSALAQERCISVGARDRTARLWKVAEETQLVFRGGGGEKKKKHSSSKPAVQEGSMDRVAMIDEETFVTGGDNGSLSLWVIHKKKPVFTMSLCHGVEPALEPEEASAETHPTADIVPEAQPRWITALATIPYSDVVLSGSWGGQLRAWRVSDDKKKLEPIGFVGASGITADGNIDGNVQEEQNNVRGIINDISVFERGDRGKDGVCVVVAVGKEHRMGRWQRQKQGKNGALVFEIPRSQTAKRNGVTVAEEDD
ncbi:related to a component of the yeast U3 snoRNP Rrp9p [Phialocephala subalpina]|uniref:Related to a component of the yeast U3 snoRNP Rrp9p n=1 Tax=Phialocephala subalpina TaxID=576137 RepID=A0A1L7XVX1_9HELO|nr:related to a component of the yeast U3 snoRNP Rrp9p [Phialocephala subalpina]